MYSFANIEIFSVYFFLLWDKAVTNFHMQMSENLRLPPIDENYVFH